MDDALAAIPYLRHMANRFDSVPNRRALIDRRGVGERLHALQAKDSARLRAAGTKELKAALDAKRGKVGPILLNSEGDPWTADGFRSSWRKACASAGVVGVTFNDLRGTAVTRLAQVEASVAQIATITGHSLRDVHAILDSHYLNRDPRMAEEAIRKLETRTKIPDRASD